MKKLFLVILLFLLVGCIVPTPTATPSPLETPLPSPLETPAQNRAEGGRLDQTKTEDEMDFLQMLMDFCMNAGLPIIAALCVVDVGFGVGAALRNKLFDWRKIGDFYLSQVLALVVPYIATLAALALVPGLIDFLPSVAAPAGLLVGIVAKLGGSIVANAGSLTGQK